MTSDYILLISEKDCDQSQIQHVFRKYRILNPILEIDRARISIEMLDGGAFGGRSPEFIILSLKSGDTRVIGLLNQLGRYPKCANVPTIVLVDNPEESRLIHDSGIPRVYSMTRPMGYFKLLEALQKLELSWTVSNRSVPGFKP